MRNWFYPVVVLCFFSGIALGQASPPETQGRSGSSSFYILNGIHFFDFPNVNQELKNAGFPEVYYQQGSTGFGGCGTFNRLVIGGQGYSFSSSSSNDTASTSIDGGLGFFYVGYKLLNKDHFDFYPMAGLGFGGGSIRIRQQQPDIRFSNFLKSPNNVGEFGTGSILSTIALAAEYRIRENNTIVVGLRGGYVFSGNAEWKPENYYFVEAPRDRFQGFYAMITAGISIGNQGK